MTLYYLRWLDDKGERTRDDPVGPYPTYKMADFMRGTYESLLKRKGEVVEVND